MASDHENEGGGGPESSPEPTPQAPTTPSDDSRLSRGPLGSTSARQFGGVDFSGGGKGHLGQHFLVKAFPSGHLGGQDQVIVGVFHFGGGFSALTPPGDKSARPEDYVR